MTTPPVFRFAPSPNGFLHLGHARSALLNFDLARKTGGRFLLRIEDIDTTRCRPDYEAAIYEDLAWLGITWEQPVRRQSEHLALYGEALSRLAGEGLLYPAYESRADIAQLVREKEEAGVWPRDPDGAPIYPGTARHWSRVEREARMQSGAPYALRLDMTSALARTGALTWTEQGEGPNGEAGKVVARPEQWGDVILARKETPTSYHLSVVVDDALQGVTHVVRGQDLFWATAVHRLLQGLLGLPEPAYRHHSLLMDESGHKLSKSTHSTALRALRAGGVTPDEVRRLTSLDIF
ncbi:tRNA glutamyl-Q(34) synthetase GluQRS [Bradyrhizobium sp. SYSU BS000235]|uniref:tRNA glutamyl-Q(34) synthetase GluQRS n=1 Tax=Bradyrhizobium sp. SYSU BS000235 TaxID=3411332 RepID=UPI003C78B83D